MDFLTAYTIFLYIVMITLILCISVLIFRLKKKKKS